MFGGTLHYGAAERCSSRKEDMVETLFEQCFCFVVVSIEYAYVVRREYIGYE